MLVKQIIIYGNRIQNFIGLKQPSVIGKNAKILSFEQMKYACADFMSTGAVKTPFGSNLVKSTAVADTKLIGLDKKCALEMINATDIILENDRLIDRQIDRTAVSVTTGFAKIIPEATRVLTIG